MRVSRVEHAIQPPTAGHAWDGDAASLRADTDLAPVFTAAAAPAASGHDRAPGFSTAAASLRADTDCAPVFTAAVAPAASGHRRAPLFTASDPGRRLVDNVLTERALAVARA